MGKTFNRMDGAGKEFFSRTALTAEQNRTVRRGDLLDLLKNADDFWVIAHNVFEAEAVKEFWHTGTMTHRSRVLETLAPESRVEINPIDARRLGLEEGDVISLASRRGRLQSKVQATQRVRSGQAFMAFHWSEAPTNRLTNPALDPPQAKIPEFKVASVKAMLAVLERAAEDNKFLAALAENPAGVLSAYDLTPEHRAALLEGDIAAIEQWIGPLEERLRVWLRARLQQERLAPAPSPAKEARADRENLMCEG